MPKLPKSEQAAILDEVERQMPKIEKVVARQAKLLAQLTDVGQKKALCALVGAWIAEITRDEQTARDLAAQMGAEIEQHALVFLGSPVSGRVQ